MKGKCIVSSCGNAASKCCGSCGLVQYCSIECQKEDWKKYHKKRECVNIKKLSSVTLTEAEVSDVADKVSFMSHRLSAAGEVEKSTYLLKECIDFIRVCLSRFDRSCISDGVKLNRLICRLLLELGEIHQKMPASSERDRNAIFYISEARELLVQMRDAGPDDEVMWRQLWICDSRLNSLCSSTGQRERATYHAVQCVNTAKQFSGPEQVDRLIASLSILGYSFLYQFKYLEAKAAGEQAYILASKHFSPAHKKVLVASGQLIDCLIEMKDYSTADTYCRMNYENLIDPKNVGEYNVDDGIGIMRRLVDIWLFKEPDDDHIVEKALADEAIDLSRKVYTHEKKNYRRSPTSNDLKKFCRVLMKGNQLTEETEGLVHKLVPVFIEENILDRFHRRNPYFSLNWFYSKLDESLPIGKKSKLVLENIDMCRRKIVEFESCDNGINGLLKIKSYFKNNVEWRI